jgi:integrase
MSAKFTDPYLKALKPEPPRYVWDELLPAFGLYVGKQAKTFVIVRSGKRTKLGHYPAIGLSEARKRAYTALNAQNVQSTAITFPDALRAFLAQPRWRASSKRVIENSLKHFSWKREIATITHEDVIHALEAIKAPSARFHAFKDLRAFFNWCIPRYLDRSPCVGIKMPSQPSRERTLTDDELLQIWQQLGDSKGDTIIRLCILTGQRRGEIPHMKIENELSTIPGQFTKNGRTHTFPVGPLTLQYYRPLVFTGFSNAKKSIDKRTGLTDWTLHDLRRTFATNHARLGTPIHVIEKILNHVSGSFGGVAGIYNRFSYLPEMKEACLRYEEWLRSTVLRQV